MTKVTVHGPEQVSPDRYTVTIMSPGGEKVIECTTIEMAQSVHDGCDAMLAAVRSAGYREHGRITGITGPWYEKARGRWVLQWVEDGKSNTATRVDRAEITALHRELTAGSFELPPLRRFGSPSFFKRAIGDVVRAAHQAANSGDLGSLKVIREYHDLLDKSAGSWLPYSRFSAALEELELLVRYMEDTGHAQAVADIRAGAAEGSIISHTLTDDDDDQAAT